MMSLRALLLATGLMACSGLLLAADIPTDVEGGEEYDAARCLATKTDSCINSVCLNSSALDCQDQCKQDAQDKCKELSE